MTLCVLGMGAWTKSEEHLNTDTSQTHLGNRQMVGCHLLWHTVQHQTIRSSQCHPLQFQLPIPCTAPWPRGLLGSGYPLTQPCHRHHHRRCWQVVPAQQQGRAGVGTHACTTTQGARCLDHTTPGPTRTHHSLPVPHCRWSSPCCRRSRSHHTMRVEASKPGAVVREVLSRADRCGLPQLAALHS